MADISFQSTRPEAGASAPTVVLGSSLGTDHTMWFDQVRLLPSEWNVVTFDLRGHGGSALSETEPTIDDFADDVIGVVDRLGVQRFAFCGLSIGGVIGQNLAVRYPDRLEALVLASTGLTILSPTALRDRAARVLDEGTGWIADLSSTRWFTESFRENHPDQVADQMSHLRGMDPGGYAHACLALAGFDGHEDAGSIETPTLVISGDDDVATPPSHSAELVAAIPGARLHRIPDAAHLCSVEQPQFFTDLVNAHVTEHR